MSNFIIEKCNDYDFWNNFVDDSPQGSVFCKYEFLNSMIKIKFSCYMVKKGIEPIAAVVILEDENNNLLKTHYPFAPYQGIMFKNFENEPNHKRIDKEHKITEFIINEIISIYGSFFQIQSPFLQDIRPFLWHNYNSPEKGMFNNVVRYTAILTLNDVAVEDYLPQIGSFRRSEYKKFNKNCVIEESCDIEILDYLHKKTFDRQNIDRSEMEKTALFNITTEALKNNYGRLSICKIDNQAASAVLFLFDKKRGYYLFGANDPEFRNSGSSTNLLLNNIMFTVNEKKLDQIDFVGANSPSRGNYKLSFNPRLYIYFATYFNAQE